MTRTNKQKLHRLKVQSEPRNLCEVAREAADRVEAERKKKDFETQRDFVKLVVGETLISQCTYDEAKNRWTICGRELEYVIANKTPYLYYRGCGANGFFSFYESFAVYTLVDLGNLLKHIDAKEMSARAVTVSDTVITPAKIYETRGFVAWCKSLFTDGRERD